MDFKNALKQVHDAVAQLAQAAGGLENQNLADIIGSAGKKLTQAMEHPDVDKVDPERALWQPEAPKA